jgi:predicted RecA/RadA family phage recombinase
LVRVDQLRSGDVVVVGEDLTVADVRPDPRRYCIVSYTNGSRGDSEHRPVVRTR